LKATFDNSVAYIYNASGSQIYSALRQLERDGLVSAEVIVQQTRPNKKVYAITDSGRTELRRWLTEQEHDKYSKDEFVAKIMFANEGPDSIVEEHILHQIQNLSHQLEFMSRERKRLAETRGDATSGDARARKYRLLSLDLKIASTKAQL